MRHVTHVAHVHAHATIGNESYRCEEFNVSRMWLNHVAHGVSSHTSGDSCHTNE